MTLDKTLPVLLAQRKMKQSDLARMTGISTGLISDYIGGRKVPSISKAVLMADAFGISLDALVGREPQGTAAQREVSAIASQMNGDGHDVREDSGWTVTDPLRRTEKGPLPGAFPGRGPALLSAVRDDHYRLG